MTDDALDYLAETAAATAAFDAIFDPRGGHFDMTQPPDETPET